MAGVLSDAQIIAYWVGEGGSISSAASALAHALAESSGSPTVTSSNPDGGTNVGLYQLDTKGVGAGYTVAQLQNPATNTKLAVQGSGNGTNWASWPDAWQSYIGQADAAVAAFTKAAGNNMQAYVNEVLDVALPLGGTGSTGSTGSSGPLGDVSSAVSSAGTLLGDAAKAMDWFFHFFKPGQGWRLAFGGAAVLAAYGGIRSWQSAAQSEESTSALPLAVLLFALASLAAFMTLRQWPQPGGKPITPGAYAVDTLEGRPPQAGAPPASDAAAIEVGLGAILALWGASKAAQGLSGLGGLLGGLAQLLGSGAAEDV